MDEIVRENKDLIDSVEDWVWETDTDFRYTYASPQVEKLLGYAPEEVVGLTPFELMPPAEARRVKEAMARYAESKTAFHAIENINLHKDGREVVLETSGAPFYSDIGDLAGFRGIDRDVSNRKENELLMNHVLSYMPGVIFKYTRFKDGRDEISYISPGSLEVWGYTPEEIQYNPEILWSQIHKDDVEEMKASVARSAESLSLWDHKYRLTDKNGKTKWVQAKGLPRETPDGVTWSTVATDVTAQIDSEKNRVEALVQNVLSLHKVSEARDAYTANHEENVGLVAVAIAEEMGLCEERRFGLKLGCLVHDIGKIRIPAEILSKPARLTEVEYNLVKTHVEEGSKLISHIQFDWPIHDILMQHHERLDGSGYPKGLKGEEICLEGRIAGVADVFEAMVNHRPYRPSVGLEVTLNELESNADKKYDAEVVNALLEVIRKGHLPDYVVRA